MYSYRHQIGLGLAFGLGLFLATVLPCRFVLIISLITVILMAWSLCRR
ncbi:MAG: hypothetical protein VZR54_04100 [Ruminococcus sp.]|jgi:hypothetical protein|nr:hypothetical protein [Ruminococcus sp.]